MEREERGALDRLPPESGRIFTRIFDERAAAYAAYREAHERVDSARMVAGQHASALAFMVDPGGMGFEHRQVEETSQYRQTKKDLDAATAELGRLKELCEARAARSQTWVGLCGNLTECLNALPRAVKISPGTKLARPPLQRGEDAPTAIERHRRRLTALAADKHSVKSAPYPTSVVKERMRAEIDGLATRGEPDLLGAIENCLAIRWPEMRAQTFLAGVEGGAVSVMVPDTSAVLAWLFRDQLIAKLDKAIDEQSDDAEALTDAQRAARLAQIGTEMLAVEREEVALIELAGGAIMYRTDTDARAVLHLSSDLPAPRNG